MRISSWCYIIVGLCAATALLAGCSNGSQPSIAPQQISTAVTAGAPLVIPDTAGRVTRRVARGAWMSPDAKRMTLLYITNANDGTVFVYSYPKGTMEGELTGFEEPYGDCTDKTGDVWIVDDEASTVTEYAHGGSTPIRTLNDSGEYPAGCSVDPTTGNLAVTNYETFSRGQGSVSIYRKAKGKPKLYSDASISRGWFCSYDTSGNLFVDGDQSGSSGFQLAELPHGSSTFTNIGINQTITVAGGVQWDGKYVAVADENGPGNGVIYQFSVSGSTGTEVSSTTLDSSENIHQFWIDPAGNRVVAPSASLGTVGYWKFPAGGNPTKTLSGFNIPEGVALSQPK
ncbi:MAG: hypothetical protein WBV67_17195 [Candidatus Cybelea sp.]